MTDVATRRAKEIAQTEAGKAAAAILHLEQAATIATRIKDASALERALIAKLESQREFAAEYKTKFPHGGDHAEQDDSTVVLGADWCLSYGFHVRTVQRWLNLLQPETYVDKNACVLDAGSRSMPPSASRAAWLEKCPWVVGVQDLRELRVMREVDVDCSISLSDGRATLAEIKSDRHLGKSGNFLFEVLRINHTAPPDRAVVLGWSARTPARQILYYAPSFNEVHSIRADEFRCAMQNYTAELRRGSRIDYVETDRIKSTLNILIPERFVIEMPSYRKFALT